MQAFSVEQSILEGENQVEELFKFVGNMSGRIPIFPVGDSTLTEFPNEPAGPIHEDYSPPGRLFSRSVFINFCVKFIAFNNRLDKCM